MRNVSEKTKHAFFICTRYSSQHDFLEKAIESKITLDDYDMEKPNEKDQWNKIAALGKPAAANI